MAMVTSEPGALAEPPESAGAQTTALGGPGGSLAIALAGAVAHRRLVLGRPLTHADAEPLVATVLGLR